MGSLWIIPGRAYALRASFYENEAKLAELNFPRHKPEWIASLYHLNVLSNQFSVSHASPIPAVVPP